MSQREFYIPMTLEDKLKIKFTSKGKNLEYFVVQYYAKIKGKWVTILRADNCHGKAHVHTYHLRSKEYKVLLDKENSIVFNENKARILKDFLKIKDNYLNN